MPPRGAMATRRRHFGQAPRSPLCQPPAVKPSCLVRPWPTQHRPHSAVTWPFVTTSLVSRWASRSRSRSEPRSWSVGGRHRPTLVHASGSTARGAAVPQRPTRPRSGRLRARDGEHRWTSDRTGHPPARDVDPRHDCVDHLDPHCLDCASRGRVRAIPHQHGDSPGPKAHTEPHLSHRPSDWSALDGSRRQPHTLPRPGACPARRRRGRVQRSVRGRTGRSASAGELRERLSRW